MNVMDGMTASHPIGYDAGICEEPGGQSLHGEETANAMDG
jgi:hypothetical protein